MAIYHFSRIRHPGPDGSDSGLECFGVESVCSWLPEWIVTMQISTDTKKSPVCLNLGHSAALSEKREIIEKVVVPAAGGPFPFLPPAHSNPLPPAYNFKHLLIDCCLLAYRLLLCSRKERLFSDFQGLPSAGLLQFDFDIFLYFFRPKICTNSSDSFQFLRLALEEEI
jgi:hypothetical protein